MTLKQARAELVDLAKELVALPVAGASDLSGRVYTAAIHLAEQGLDEEPDPASEAVAYLDSELEQFPKKRAWWTPPRNFAINQALMGYNFWRFTILPLFPKRMAYRESLGGFVIHPNWTPVDHQLLIRELDLGVAKKMVALAKGSSTVQDDVRKELAWIETTFSIRIPEAIQSKIVRDALPTAKRRWGVDRLRIKDQLIPLDGSPPRNV